METYRNFTFRKSINTGGKAGKGNNETTSIHVVGINNHKSKYFSYKLNDIYGFSEAYNKAKKWVDNILDNQNKKVR